MCMLTFMCVAMTKMFWWDRHFLCVCVCVCVCIELTVGLPDSEVLCKPLSQSWFFFFFFSFSQIYRTSLSVTKFTINDCNIIIIVMFWDMNRVPCSCGKFKYIVYVFFPPVPPTAGKRTKQGCDYRPSIPQADHWHQRREDKGDKGSLQWSTGEVGVVMWSIIILIT